MIHPIRLGEGQLTIRPIYGGGRRIDEVLEPRQPARHLQNDEMPHHIRLDIGEGIDQRVPDARLCREVHHARHLRAELSHREQRGAVGDIEMQEGEAAPALQPGQAGALQPRVVVRRQVVDTDHLLATRKKRLGHMHADEPGHTGEKDGHARTSRSSRSSITACPRAMCASWIRAVTLLGTTSAWSHNPRAGPPSRQAVRR